jgi:plasmid stabilization system protein ParE
MTKAESELTEALRERLKIISDEESRRNPEQHVKRLREISDRVETLAADLPQPVPPRLAHFLERRSYDKALEFLCSSSGGL